MGYNNYAGKMKKVQTNEFIRELFSEIDKSVSKLNQYSYNCFLLIHKSLSEKRGKTSSFSETVSKIHEISGKKGSSALFTEIRSAIYELKEELKIFENEIDVSLRTLEVIHENLCLISEPFMNLRNNLKQLNILLANTKLTNTFKDRSFRSFSNDEAIQIHAVINKLKESSPLFEENIFNILKHIKSYRTELEKIKNELSVTTVGGLEKLESFISHFETHHKSFVSTKNDVEERLVSINRVVANMSSKMEARNTINRRLNHIKDTQKLLFKEILQSQDSVRAQQEDQLNLKVSKITDTQIDRLLYTRKEYQAVVYELFEGLSEIDKEVKTIVTTINETELVNPDLTSVDGTCLDDYIKNLISKKDNEIKSYMDITNDMALLYKILNELFDKFKDLEMMEHVIEQKVIDKISFGDLLISEDLETASHAQQILKVYADNHFEKNKIRTLFSQSSEHLKSFIESRSVYMIGKKGIDSIDKNFDGITKSICDFTNNLNSFRNLISDNDGELKPDSDKGIDVKEKMKLYDFPRNDINQLIDKFEYINQLIKEPIKMEYQS